jgi:glycerol-3-phosphate acyltransferase PlsY
MLAVGMVGKTAGVAVGIVLLSFVLGSVPSSYLAARATRGVDLRQVRTKTVSGTSLFYVSGVWAVIVTGMFDVFKGAAGPLLAGDHLVVAAFAGGAAVAGHNWSLFLRGAGGRGLAPALGALLVNSWPGVVILAAGMLLGKLCRQTALFVLVAELSLAPVLGIVDGATAALAGAAVALPMVVKRVVGNERPRDAGWRVYVHRLLFDHDPAPRPS